MPKTVMDYYLWDIERLPLKDKETLFWEFCKLLENETLLVKSFTLPEVKQLISISLSEEDYRKLKKNPRTYGEAFRKVMENSYSDVLSEG